MVFLKDVFQPPAFLFLHLIDYFERPNFMLSIMFYADDTPATYINIISTLTHLTT